MTDRELLELAAKAAEINIWPEPWGGINPTGSGVYRVNEGGNTSFSWNPLTDDGDALRLAVVLEKQMDSQFVMYFGCQDVIADIGRDDEIAEFHTRGSDAFAAARRAIVRAAAEIGKDML